MRETRPDIQLKKLEIVSNKGKSVDVSNGFSEMYYYESILQNSVITKITYADSGNRNFGGETSSSSEANDVDIQYAEKVLLQMEDTEDGKIHFHTPDKSLHFIARPKIIGTTRSEVISAYLASKEYLTNQFEENRVQRTYEGKISETVKTILTKHLKTQKRLFIEDTLNNLKIDGRIDDEAMPFNVINELSKKSVPIVPSKRTEGYTAGFFFYETSDGYHFKSIDNLLKQKPIKKYVWNNTTRLPNGYDGKILTYSFLEGPAFTKQMEAGTNKSTKITWNPITHKVEKATISATEQNTGAVRAEKNLPFVPEEFNKSSHTTSSTLDIGQLSYGVTEEEQLKNSQTENFKVGEILNQSKMRFNQLFSLQLTVTIFCDFSLHAGDVIDCSFPEITSKTTQLVSRKKSGKYLIVDLCHYISPVGPNFTKINLVRDSFG